MTKGYKKISPFFIPYSITNMGGALLAIDQVGLDRGEGRIAGAEGNGQVVVKGKARRKRRRRVSRPAGQRRCGGHMGGEEERAGGVVG